MVVQSTPSTSQARTTSSSTAIASTTGAVAQLSQSTSVSQHGTAGEAPSTVTQSPTVPQSASASQRSNAGDTAPTQTTTASSPGKRVVLIVLSTVLPACAILCALTLVLVFRWRRRSTSLRGSWSSWRSSKKQNYNASPFGSDDRTTWSNESFTTSPLQRTISQQAPRTYTAASGLASFPRSKEGAHPEPQTELEGNMSPP